MANEITTLINIPSEEVASKTFIASNYMPLAGGEFTGAVSFPYRAITALTTLDNTDYTIDCTANSFTVTLPTAVGITGRVYNIKNSGTGSIVVATTSSQTIDGQLTQTLSQYDAITVVSNGANFIII